MIEILNGTKTPLYDIGLNAGYCWHSPVDNAEKNIKRAKSCILSGHGRVMEYPDVTIVIKGYSARCIRELYTHVIGTTRLQASTRYVDCNKFEFYTPPTLTGEEGVDENKKKAAEEYARAMETIRTSYKTLLECGISKEDAANLLPLGMHTEVVLKINVRALEHFMNMRLCTRAYKEIRALAKEIKETLANYSDEWKWIADTLFVPNCEKYGYCTEEHCCGRRPKKETFFLDFVSSKQG